ncbi:unnamed protein product [Arctia plantaginis]|uniref:FP protein C-terminal domain-containing protein n=1 Tax=Arctia plantaginis TaxID=874455 RepID=A0A8S0ZNU3_ARCPL|nr:unnamed protein product [Arctia plantaginis]
MKGMFSQLVIQQNQQNEKIDSLHSALDEIRSQNSVIRKQNVEIHQQNDEIQKTVIFLSERYDDALLQISNLKEECNNNKKTVKALESKVDYLEKHIKSASLEFKNLPPSIPETRETLTESIKKLGDVINQPVTDANIKNIFRLKGKMGSPGTVMVEFSTEMLKEGFLGSAKYYNKQNKDNRLNSYHLSDVGPRQPLYVSEALTAMTKRLYYLAREFIKSSEYEQCWTANGKVYIREKEGRPKYLIRTEEDLVGLRRRM